MVSSSYDGFCRVWDVRAAGAQGSLYTIKREGGDAAIANAGGIKKVFDVKWSKEVGIVSGGEDKRVQVNSGVSVAGEGGELTASLGGKL